MQTNLLRPRGERLNEGCTQALETCARNTGTLSLDTPGAPHTRPTPPPGAAAGERRGVRLSSGPRQRGRATGHDNGGIPRTLDLRKVLLVVVSVPAADLALGVAREEAIATPCHVQPVDHGTLI